MKSKDVNKVESSVLALTIYSDPDDYFWNAYEGMLLALDQESIRFCFGYYRNINSKERFVFEHAWLEINGIIFDPSLSIFGPSKLEDYIYIEFFSLTAEETKNYRAYAEETNLKRVASSERIIGFNLFGYLEYGEKYDDFAKGMDIVAAENYTCIDRNSLIRLGFYNDMNGPLNELTFERMLIKKPSDETV